MYSAYLFQLLMSTIYVDYLLFRLFISTDLAVKELLAVHLLVGRQRLENGRVQHLIQHLKAVLRVMVWSGGEGVDDDGNDGDGGIM